MMRRIKRVYSSNKFRLRFLALIVTVLSADSLQAQCDALEPPNLFGPSSNFIFCKNEIIPIGVNFSDTDGTDQFYYFSKYVNGVEVSRKGGPLDGNGGQLSVNAFMRSASDAGEYRVTTGNACGATASKSFYAFYGAIDNLSISAWGGNSVTFRWSPCGPSLATITYEYAITTSRTPPTDGTAFPVDTFATVSSGLTAGTTYYIHVRLNSVELNGNLISNTSFSDGCGGSTYPWSTIRFVSCSGAASVGTLSPINPVSCIGGSTTLTASGGTSYRWYKDYDTTAIAVGSTTYSPSVPGQYSAWITTAAGCRGIFKTTTYTQTPPASGNFFGGGSFFAGDTVRLGLSNTSSEQTYKILKDGVEVYSMLGIGNPNETTSPDSVYYKFAITSAAQAGLYSVRTTPPNCATVDFGNATVSLVTAVTICPNANTSLSFSSYGNNTAFQWQVDQGGGFANVNNGGVYSNATTKTLTITGATISMYGFKYRCVCTGGSPTVTSSERALKFGETWIGTTNVWATASNWGCNLVPTASLDLIIPAGTPNQPVITTTNATCHSILFKPGATLNVNNTNSKLTITGQ